jgi:hypothetical protein
LPTSVNFPEVALPAHPGKHRLLHIHRKVPGVLSEINKVFADNRINIPSQYLQTNDAIGYVVIDIDAAHSDMALVKLAEVPGTIRSRVLFGWKIFREMAVKRNASPPVIRASPVGHSLRGHGGVRPSRSAGRWVRSIARQNPARCSDASLVVSPSCRTLIATLIAYPDLIEPQWPNIPSSPP